MFTTGGNLNERQTEFDQQLKQLAQIVGTTAKIQSKSVMDIAQIRYELEDLVLMFGSLSTSINTLFSKVERTLETVDKVVTMSLNVAVQNASDNKLATANALTVSRSLVQILDVLMQANELTSEKDFLATMQTQLHKEIAIQELTASQEKEQLEQERAEELEERNKKTEADLAKRRA